MKFDLLFKDEKVQYNFNRELALLSRKTDKIEYLTWGETLPSTYSPITKPSKFTISVLWKSFKEKQKQLKGMEKTGWTFWFLSKRLGSLMKPILPSWRNYSQSLKLTVTPAADPRTCPTIKTFINSNYGINSHVRINSHSGKIKHFLKKYK